MRATSVATLVAVGCFTIWPSHAGGGDPQKLMHEIKVREISAKQYTDLLRLACFNGFRYRQEVIRNGYRRHYEELRLSLIDQGYTIIPDLKPTHLIVALIATGQALRSEEMSEPGCFRARWRIVE